MHHVTRLGHRAGHERKHHINGHQYWVNQEGVNFAGSAHVLHFLFQNRSPACMHRTVQEEMRFRFRVPIMFTVTLVEIAYFVSIKR